MPQFTEVTIGPCRLINADCMEVLPTLGQSAVDMVVTDPPYGARRPSQWRNASERFSEIEGNDRINAEWAGFKSVAIGAAIYSFCTWDTLQEWKTSIAGQCATIKCRSCIVWDKEVHGLADLETCWAPRHELILMFSVGRHELRSPRPVDVIRCQKVTPTELLHPYQKPRELIERLILASSDRGQVVADYFMGSGTTGVACITTGRQFIGIEKDPGHFSTAVKRIQQAWDLKCSELPFEPVTPFVQKTFLEPES